MNTGDAPSTTRQHSVTPDRRLQRFEPWPAPQLAARHRLARHLHGSGLELGPGHQPYETPEDVEVRFVDRWVPRENRTLFPELVEIGVDDGFVEPHVVAHFDRDRLHPVETASADFVICSHVLEHLAEPLGFLGEIYRVLRPGGTALILLPDRRRTFDRSRPPTPLEHLIDEHRRGVTEVDDAHMIEFLTLAGEGASFLGVPEDEGERQRFFDWHRERSIHVHCWSEEEFPAVIAHCIDDLGHRWELVDLLTVAEEGPDGIEFGYVLRRSMSEARSTAHPSTRFLDDWLAMYSERSAVDALLGSAVEGAPEPAGAPPEPAKGATLRQAWLRRLGWSSAPPHHR